MSHKAAADDQVQEDEAGAPADEGVGELAVLAPAWWPEDDVVRTMVDIRDLALLGAELEGVNIGLPFCMCRLKHGMDLSVPTMGSPA